MDTHHALVEMLEASGMSSYRVSIGLGRHSSYVSTMLRRGSVPSADLLARMADVCGYELRLVPRNGAGDALMIDGRPGG